MTKELNEQLQSHVRALTETMLANAGVNEWKQELNVCIYEKNAQVLVSLVKRNDNNMNNYKSYLILYGSRFGDTEKRFKEVMKILQNPKNL